MNNPSNYIAAVVDDITDPVGDSPDPMLGVLSETPVPPMDHSPWYRSPTPNESTPLPPSISEEDPSRHVSFQDLLQDENKPRPLPPIGSDVYCRDGSLPHKARRLPPLSYGQYDAISLTSASSSQSQLIARAASTNSLPDPRYSSDPRTAGRRGKKKKEMHSKPVL